MNAIDKIKDYIREKRVCFYRTTRALKDRLFLNKKKTNPRGRIFSHNAHQVFFGYYDINPFSSDEKLLLAKHAPPENLPPVPESQLTVGYYDLNRDDSLFFEVGSTTTWCWQQGCRLRWYPASSNRTILYNKLVDGGYGCVVQDIKSKEYIRSYKRPIYDVSKNGKWGLSLNFSRLHRLRPGYGYVNLPDETDGQLAPETDGIWRIDMETGEEKFLFSVSEIASFEPLESMENAEHYFNHILFNPAGTRFMFFHLWLNRGERFIRLITCDIDGSNRYALINEGHVSHYIWKSNDEILAYSTHADTGVNYHLYEDKTYNRRIIGEGVLIEDGHPSYSKDGSLLLLDTYPDKYREQCLMIYNPDSNALFRLGSYFVPFAFRGELRCDLHPRWSPSSNHICFDSVTNGKRSMYIIGLNLDYSVCEGRSDLFIDRRSRLLRYWSNKEILKLAPFFKGDVVNISGWDDRDKEGGHYKDYFVRASSYTISNYSGERGFDGVEHEIFLDLTQDLPKELVAKFDVCFNHTTLEHIFDVQKAFSNICEMSRDIVLLVVPFSQAQHETESFKDYWRFTPSCIQALFKENGMDIIYETQSPYKNAAVYLLFIGSKNPNRWQSILPAYAPVGEAGTWIGRSWTRSLVSAIKRKWFGHDS